MKGHIRERGKGNWYAVFRRKDPATGKQKLQWHKLNASGKREAQSECSTLISQLSNRTYLPPSKATLNEFLERWLNHIKPNVGPKTHERYTEICKKNIAPLLGEIVLSSLDGEQISGSYAKALERGRRDGRGGLSPQTVVHMHRVLKKALKQAVRWKKLTANPADNADAPRFERRKLVTLDVPQTAALLEALRGQRVFVPTVLAALCGLRRGEIAALRWRALDFQNRNIAIVESAEQTRAGVRYKEPKSGRSRNVALSSMVVEELRTWKIQQAQEMLRLGIRVTEDMLVCTTALGGGIQPDSLTHEFQKAIRATTLPRIRFHDLRHAHATHMLASGVHPKVASERLGHSKVGITLDLYSHVLPGMQEDAVARVDAAFRDAKKP